MRILFAPHGTRGDVQPLIPLGLAAKSRGHDVRFVVPANMVGWIREHDLACESNGVDVAAIMQDLENKVSVVRPKMLQAAKASIPRMFEAVLRNARGMELIVGSGTPLVAPSVAELCGVTFVHTALYAGALPNDEVPPPGFRNQGMPPWASKTIWSLLPLFRGGPYGRWINQARVKHGMPKRRNPVRDLLMGRTVIAADPELAPSLPGLPPSAVHTGYLPYEDREKVLEPRVEAFLRAGPPPVYVGFGSMTAAKSKSIAERVVAAADAAGCRVILAGGWARFGEGLVESDRLLRVSEAPHNALFPRVAAAVHHGGAGTTTTAVRAGIPQFIAPHLFDQYYWGLRVERLQLGPPSVVIERLSTGVLTGRLKALLNDERFRKSAADLGTRARTRDGLAATLKYIEALDPRLQSRVPGPLQARI